MTIHVDRKKDQSVRYVGTSFKQVTTMPDNRSSIDWLDGQINDGGDEDVYDPEADVLPSHYSRDREKRILNRLPDHRR